MKILLVEDNPDLMAELKEYLEINDFTVQAALDAHEALCAIGSDSSIAVVLTDFAMPGMNGLEMAQQIHLNCPEAAAIEVVVMTGYRSIEAKPPSVFELFHKPVPLKALTASLHNALAAAAVRRKVASSSP